MKKIIGILTVFLVGVGFYVAAPSGDKVILPAPSTTGLLNPDVTQATIGQTICQRGWTSTIRPPATYTSHLKASQLVGTYSYYSDKIPSDYEEDHLISLELGGSPTSPANLWPEPYAGKYGARVKDQLENKLKRLICSGRISLTEAQQAISSNWYSAYLKYVKGMK